jgi:HAMP domain-containing protein
MPDLKRKYIERIGPGRRKDDKFCPYHEAHEIQLANLAADMKTKIGLKTLVLIVTILLALPAVSYLAISRYVESATTNAVQLLRVHIEKSEFQMERINKQLTEQNATLRVMNYRLNQLDKTPEYPQRFDFKDNTKPGAY